MASGLASAMLGHHVSAQVNALIADHDRMTARHLATARNELLDLMSVRAAKRTLRHVAPVWRAICGGKAPASCWRIHWRIASCFDRSATMTILSVVRSLVAWKASERPEKVLPQAAEQESA